MKDQTAVMCHNIAKYNRANQEPEMTPIKAAEKLEIVKEMSFPSYAKLIQPAIDYLRKIASGEYKQVVQCKVCERWQNDGVHNYGMCQNPNIGSVKMDTDFCSYGERKEPTHE